MKQTRKSRLVIAAALAAVIASTLVFVPAAMESSTSNGLFAYVVPTTRGPLRACTDTSTCAATGTVWHFIYVANANRLSNLNGGTTRATLQNSFVVSSVDQRVFIDGVEQPSFAANYTPAPSPNLRSWAGHWPTTVKCQPGAPPDPCNEIHNPAVVPGEVASVLYTGWSHGADEPDGTYVFRYTIHGSLNGTAVDLTASSPPISMTR
jgi:hypothetical protein